MGIERGRPAATAVLGSGLHSDPECDDGGEDDGGQEVEGELVITRGHAPEVLEATEGCFNPPAITIPPLIVADRAFA